MRRRRRDGGLKARLLPRRRPIVGEHACRQRRVVAGGESFEDSPEADCGDRHVQEMKAAPVHDPVTVRLLPAPAPTIAPAASPISTSQSPTQLLHRPHFPSRYANSWPVAPGSGSYPRPSPKRGGRRLERRPVDPARRPTGRARQGRCRHRALSSSAFSITPKL